MKIGEIPNILKSYSFHSRAGICNTVSSRFVQPYQIRLKDIQDESFLFPTELETLKKCKKGSPQSYKITLSLGKHPSRIYFNKQLMKVREYM